MNLSTRPLIPGCPSGRGRSGRRTPSPAPAAGAGTGCGPSMGGEVTPLSWRKCQKVAPSWSACLGPPLGVVLPSATSRGTPRGPP